MDKKLNLILLLVIISTILIAISSLANIKKTTELSGVPSSTDSRSDGSAFFCSMAGVLFSSPSCDGNYSRGSVCDDLRKIVAKCQDQGLY